MMARVAERSVDDDGDNTTNSDVVIRELNTFQPKMIHNILDTPLRSGASPAHVELGRVSVCSCAVP
jgi:hypothetical protein